MSVLACTTVFADELVGTWIPQPATGLDAVANGLVFTGQNGVLKGHSFHD